MGRPAISVAAMGVLVAAIALVSATGAIGGTGCKNTVGGSLTQCIIGSGGASGQRLAKAKGTAVRPKHIYAIVYTSNSQTVHGEWSMTCARRPGGPEGFKGKTFVADAVSPGNPQPNPLNRRGWWTRILTLKMPMRRPASCHVQADAGLTSGGSLRIYILAIRRS